MVKMCSAYREFIGISRISITRPIAMNPKNVLIAPMKSSSLFLRYAFQKKEAMPISMNTRIP